METSTQTVATSAPTRWQRIVRHEHFALWAIVLVSTLLNLILVFQGSQYQQYLTSDMHGYWERAQQIFRGDEMDPNTWVSNAPFYPRVIAMLFAWLSYFHLDGWFLEAILSVNILVCALGTFALFGIGKQVLGSHRGALWLAGVYAFSYPRLYFNTFVLGEPFAVPLIICAIWLMYRWRDSYHVAWSGLLLAFAVGVRPSNGLLAAPLALYILFAGHDWRPREWRQWWPVLWPRVLRTAAFSAAFLAFIFTILAENNRISHGQLRGMTAHTGYNFFLGQAQSHKIVSSYDGITYIFVPSSVAGNPEYGTVTTNIPIYASERFFEEGKKILAAHPGLYWDHLKDYRQLFFDNLFPAVPSVWGFSLLFDPFRYISFFMLVFSGLAWIGWRERSLRRADVLLFGSIFGLCSASLFFFTITHQYFLNFSYSVYVLAALALASVLRHYQAYRRSILAYLGVVLLATAAHYGWQAVRKHFIEQKIRVTIEQNDGEIMSFSQPKKVTHTERIIIDKLRFTESESLTHISLGDLPFVDTFYMTAETELEVLKEGIYMLTFYADDGYEVLIDGQRVMGHDGLKKMDEFQTRITTFLTAGRHKMQVRYFDNGVFSGLVGYYRLIDPSQPPASPYEYNTRRGQGRLIGEDDANIRFHLPAN